MGLGELGDASCEVRGVFSDILEGGGNSSAPRSAPAYEDDVFRPVDFGRIRRKRTEGNVYRTRDTDFGEFVRFANVDDLDRVPTNREQLRKFYGRRFFHMRH